MPQLPTDGPVGRSQRPTRTEEDTRPIRLRHARPRTIAAVATLAAGAAIPADAHAAFGDRTLRKGHRGADVRTLQRSLTTLGLRTSADGQFGRRTRRNVLRYERRHDFRRDGLVSPKQARGMVKRVAAARADATTSPAPDEAEAPSKEVDGDTAVLAQDGRTALAPAAAPQQVKDAIAAANRITRAPYRYGGGHGQWKDSGYDCSGAVSYALHGAGLLRRSRNSSGFETYGKRGAGRWITVYANAGHAYVVIAGLRFDTSGAGEDGPRWRPEPRSGKGYRVRHPDGL